MGRKQRTYTAHELKAWLQLPMSEVSSWEFPNDALPFKYVRVVAMHSKRDRRNNDRQVWLSKNVVLDLRHGEGAPVVSPSMVPVSTLVERFKSGESPVAIAAALSARDSAEALDAPAVISALQWAQRTATSKGAWTRRKLDAGTAEAVQVLHGVPLVDEVIAWNRKSKRIRPKGGVARAKVKKWKLSGGRPLPPSLATWVAYDTSMLACTSGGKLVEASLPDILAALHQEDWPPLSRRYPGSCYLLDVGDQQATFLYCGQPDRLGEYPVLTLASDEEPACFLVAPGFDVYLGIMTGYFPEPAELGDVPLAYRKRMAGAQKLL